jgi:ABC-type phosphate transport system substrate-binding protein
MKLSIVAQSALALLSLVGVAHAEVPVIVNPALGTTPTQSDVANIFLGKDKSLKGVDQDNWSPTKEKFYTAVTSKSESQLKSYWSGLVFTGKGQPLPHVANDGAVVAQVSSQPDAVGYVDKAAVNDKVKVLFTLP